LIEQETAAWNFLQARAMTKFPSEIQDQIHFTGQNPNVKGMSKLKVQNIWHWGFVLDLAFELGALAFDHYGKPIAAAGAAGSIEEQALA
jgi:hypothetical protein